MSSQENSVKRISFSIMIILVVSLSLIAIYPTLSGTAKINSIALFGDISTDVETSDLEKDFSEESISLFCFEFSRVKFQKSASKLRKTPSVFLIPCVFYDTQVQPPESLAG